MVRGLLLALCLVMLCASPASARPVKKGIWGPVDVNGVSQFPIYKQLRASVVNRTLLWRNVALQRPTQPLDPRDPAYRWPAEMDVAAARAKRHGMDLAVRVDTAPAWANGNRPANWAPNDPADFAAFVGAAARRYPSVRFWIIWGEPTRAAALSPIPPTHPTAPLTDEARSSVQTYARLLDGAYAALKRISTRKVVIGGNSFTGGDISPFNWIRYMRLPNGRRPRMDMYGHNPFGSRRPRLSDRPLVRGYADFSDLDDLARWLDRYYGRDSRRQRMRIWIGEWLVPTDGRNHSFNFSTTRSVQASWLESALRIAGRWPRIYAFNWYTLYDEPPNAAGDETHWGLIDAQGRRKPAFNVFRRG